MSTTDYGNVGGIPIAREGRFPSSYSSSSSPFGIPRWSESALLTALSLRVKDGATVFVDLTKFPGPQSYSPVEGFQPMTPIPATVNLWQAPRMEGRIVGIVQRSGFPPEPIAPVPFAKTMVELWRMAYADRVGYMDSSGYRVVLARVSQIDIVPDSPVVPGDDV